MAEHPAWSRCLDCDQEIRAYSAFVGTVRKGASYWCGCGDAPFEGPPPNRTPGGILRPGRPSE